MIPLLIPPPLNKGDTVGIVAPAGRLVDKERFVSGVKILQEMGFAVKFPRDLWPGLEYLADSDENRGDEFNRLIGDSEVKALIALRGGYGCLRMIDKIDLAQVVAHPKMIVGFSDMTILQNFLYDRTGLLSLHGPVVTSLGQVSRAARERLVRCLAGKWHQTLAPPNLEILQNGPAVTAPLVGGNLASLVALLGTRYDFSWDRKILLLEDVNEPPYRIDRMLTQLQLAGKFEKIAGLLLGDFSGPESADSSAQNRYLETIWRRVLELCGDLGIPIWGNFPSGHCRHSLTLPLGALARMEREKCRLLFPAGSSRQARHEV
jgi:muramoyltetrapeptide carboxypeptidase